MATGFYLLDHPPVSPQFRRPRRGKFTGAIGIHTAESIIDNIGPDTGAENVASYITRRTDPGSYHHLFDSDSHVPMLPDNSEAFSIAADGLNRTTVNMAFACRTTDLNPADPWTDAAFTRMAAEIVACWQRNHIDPWTAARWLTREQVLAGWSGVFHHGTVQPHDRSDAFTRHSQRQALERLMLDKIIALLTPTPTPSPEDDDMRWLYYHGETTGTEIVVCSDGKVRAFGPEALRELRAAEVIPPTPKRVPDSTIEQFMVGGK